MKKISYVLSLLLTFSASFAFAQIDLDFSHKRGFYDDSFQLTITADDPDATIRYELDSNPDCPDTDSGTIYNGSVTIPDDEDLITIKVIAYNGNETSKVYTHSYLFTPEVTTVVFSESPYEEAPDENEDPISFEFIVPSDSPLKSVQEYAGSRESAGGISAGQSDKVYFREAYGAGRLKEDLFSDFYYGIAPKPNIDQLFLRADHSDDSYLRQIFSHDAELAMGNLAPHGRIVYLYEFGTGKGVRHLHERPEAGFMDAYYGGGKEKYEAWAGSFDSGSGFDDIRDNINSLATLEQYVDAQSLVDHLLICWYSSAWDYWDDRNWRVAGPKEFNDPEGVKFNFFVWDLDMGYKDSTTSDDTNDSPDDIVDDLEDDPDFVSYLADRYHCTCENDGAFTSEKMIDRLLIRYDQMDEITDAYGMSNPADDWKDDMVDEWIEDRHDNYKSILQDADLHPDMDAVEFNQYGGFLGANDEIELDNPNGSGTIYYTIDGTDPRLPGGNVHPDAIEYDGEISLPDGVHEVFARIHKPSENDEIDRWSSACPRKFYANVNYSSIAINEIMYNPDSLCAVSDASELDYIELTNAGTEAVNLADCTFNRGLTFEFPYPTIIEPGDYLVLAENAEEFEQTYGFAPFGEYKGKLSNDGEFLQISDPFGNIIDSLEYNDKNPWDELPDGDGPSLELLDPLSDNNDPLNWFRSDNPCGTPGEENSRVCTGTATSIIINEINYNSDGANFAPGDWVELYNPNPASVDLSGWTFYDNGNAFVVPQGTDIDAEGFIILTQDEAAFSSLFPHLTDEQVVGDLDFSLSNKGERISFFDEDKCLSDYVVYNDKLPWDTIPDGDGPTLSLIMPDTDNAEAASWEASSNIDALYGTPGRPNEPCLIQQILAPDTVCVGLSALFTLDVLNERISYNWFTFGGILSSTDTDSTYITWDTPGTYTVQLVSNYYECTKIYSQQIVVASCNTAPFLNDDDFVIAEDNMLSNGMSLLSNDVDPEGDNVIVNETPVLPPANGTLVLRPDGTFDYTPNPDFNGNDSFQYEVCDDGNPVACDIANVNITVVPVNDAPVATAGLFTLDEDASYIDNVNDYITDAEGDEITINVTLVSLPENGSVFILASGFWAYTPNPNYHGPDNFSYEICDNGNPSLCTTGIIDMIVSPVNDAPIAVADTLYAVAGSITVDNVLQNDSDIDGDNLTASITMNPANGTLSIQPDGTVSYQADSGYSGTEQFSYQVCDTEGLCSTADAIIIVEGDACTEVELYVFLEGAYDKTGNQMLTSLNTIHGLLPGQIPTNSFAIPTPAGQPYNTTPWNYAGSEGAGWTDNDYPADAVDWVLVSFRTDVQKGTEIVQVAALLNKDGSVYFVEDCILPDNASDLYVVIEHRNHVGVMSPAPVSIVNGRLYYDFRAEDSYNDETSFGQKAFPSNNWGMFAGDTDQSDSPSYDINGLDKSIWIMENGGFGEYTKGDMNMDADVNGLDKAVWNSNNGVSSRVPK